MAARESAEHQAGERWGQTALTCQSLPEIGSFASMMWKYKETETWTVQHRKLISCGARERANSGRKQIREQRQPSGRQEGSSNNSFTLKAARESKTIVRAGLGVEMV